MFGPLATCYLFFGGVGAGALFVACAVDLFAVREPFGQDVVGSSLETANPFRRMLAFCFAAGFGMVAFGILCLLFDVGRIDRALALFANPTFTYLSVGSFALAALAVAGAALTAIRVCRVGFFSRRAATVLEIVTLALSATVMAYTGLLLAGLGTVPLWDTPLIPALFLLSSLSAGCAVLMCAAYLAASGLDASLRPLVRTVSACDVALIALEAGCATLFVLGALESHRASASALELLTAGGLATALWWVAFAGFGLAAPFVLELAARRRDFGPFAGGGVRAACAVAGVLVIVGAFGLRASVVEAGQHRPLELQDPAFALQAPDAVDAGEEAAIAHG